MMYAATGDARFKERVDYIVRELKEVQDKYGDGYLGALANGKEQFIEVSKGNIRSASFDLNGLWSPWYVLHKTYAGLRDAYRYAGNRAALELEIKFAAWAESILAKLDDAQSQKMLNTEFGGMPEVLADLYVDTGDKRWLDLSHRFDHRAVLDPLARRQDILDGLHGNTQVPKIQGSLVRYAYTGDKIDGEAAHFFWDIVVKHHSFATGGHGKDEYFGPSDVLSDRIDGRTAETCNVYNMIKMTRKLFALHPDIKYAEFHERALFNHILGSIDAETGGLVTWFRSDAAFSASIRTCSAASPAASAPAWKATRCTATGYITNRATSCGSTSMRPPRPIGKRRALPWPWTRTFPRANRPP